MGYRKGFRSQLCVCIRNIIVIFRYCFIIGFGYCTTALTAIRTSARFPASLSCGSIRITLTAAVSRNGLGLLSITACTTSFLLPGLCRLFPLSPVMSQSIYFSPCVDVNNNIFPCVVLVVLTAVSTVVVCLPAVVQFGSVFSTSCGLQVCPTTGTTSIDTVSDTD